VLVTSARSHRKDSVERPINPTDERTVTLGGFASVWKLNCSVCAHYYYNLNDYNCIIDPIPQASSPQQEVPDTLTYNFPKCRLDGQPRKKRRTNEQMKADKAAELQRAVDLLDRRTVKSNKK
jgi:hypothetical protein